MFSNKTLHAAPPHNLAPTHTHHTHTKPEHACCTCAAPMRTAARGPAVLCSRGDLGRHPPCSHNALHPFLCTAVPCLHSTAASGPPCSLASPFPARPVLLSTALRAPRPPLPSLHKWSLFCDKVGSHNVHGTALPCLYLDLFFYFFMPGLLFSFCTPFFPFPPRPPSITSTSIVPFLASPTHVNPPM